MRPSYPLSRRMASGAPLAPRPEPRAGLAPLHVWQPSELDWLARRCVSWVLPLHETVETFLAGTIFAVASNFILIGSTKIVT
eukprot:3082878-Prymnesium_polylepis.2